MVHSQQDHEIDAKPNDGDDCELGQLSSRVPRATLRKGPQTIQGEVLDDGGGETDRVGNEKGGAETWIRMFSSAKSVTEPAAPTVANLTKRLTSFRFVSAR